MSPDLQSYLGFHTILFSANNLHKIKTKCVSKTPSGNKCSETKRKYEVVNNGESNAVIFINEIF